MAWTSPKTWVVGETVNAAGLNTHIRDQWNAFSTHAHSGAAGDGNEKLGVLDAITFDFISIPSAPGASKLIIYTKAGGVYWREGAGGAEVQASETTHTH